MSHLVSEITSPGSRHHHGSRTIIHPDGYFFQITVELNQKLYYSTSYVLIITPFYALMPQYSIRIPHSLSNGRESVIIGTYLLSEYS